MLSGIEIAILIVVNTTQLLYTVGLSCEKDAFSFHKLRPRLMIRVCCQAPFYKRNGCTAYGLRGKP
jgi:hypothetical protein